MRVCLSLCVPAGMGSWATGCWSRSCSRGWWRRWPGCPWGRWRPAGGTRPALVVRAGLGWQLGVLLAAHGGACLGERGLVLSLEHRVLPGSGAQG